MALAVRIGGNQMTQFRLSAAMWKWLISALALLCAISLITELRHAFRPLLVEHRHGSLGVTLIDEFGASRDGQGTYFLRIDRLAPGSPLLAAGARPGDRLKYDRIEDRWRKFAIGETIGLAFFQANGERHVTAVAQAAAITFSEYVDYGGRCLLALPGLLFSLLIGFKQAEAKAYRALSLMFIAMTLTFYYTFNYSPAGPGFALAKFASTASFALIWYCGTVFALHYQPYRQTGLRHWLTRAFAPYRALVFITTAYAVWYALGKEAPLLWLAIFLSLVGGMFMVTASLVDGWRQCAGETRQRHLWLLLSLGLGAVPAMLVWIPALDWSFHGMRIIIMAMFAGEFLMYVGLAYAVLRYRIFNFDFAISRALVFSVVSLLLVCSFGLVEWLSKSYLHGGGGQHGTARNSLFIDAALALSAYLVFHKMHRSLERRVERIFFRKWHDNEEKLRQYVRQAAHITTVDALLASLCTAMDRFTAQAGCAIYLKQPNGGYALATGTLEHAPARVDADDGLAAALRADMSPLPHDHLHSEVPGDLTVPMSHRGTLNGFITLGAKAEGHSYRPDECEVLSFTAHQIGLDLHALRVEALEHELQQLEHKTQQQSAEMLQMAGRRKHARQLSGS
jgi:GAF domain-containing protein